MRDSCGDLTIISPTTILGTPVFCVVVLKYISSQRGDIHFLFEIQVFFRFYVLTIIVGEVIIKFPYGG